MVDREHLSTASIEEVRSRFIDTYGLKSLSDIKLAEELAQLWRINFQVFGVIETDKSGYDPGIDEFEKGNIEILDIFRQGVSDSGAYAVLCLGGGSVKCRDGFREDDTFDPWLARLMAYCGADVLNVDMGAQADVDVKGDSPLFQHLRADVLADSTVESLEGRNFDLIVCEGLFSISFPSEPIFDLIRGFKLPESIYSEMKNLMLKELPSLIEVLGPESDNGNFSEKTAKELFHTRVSLIKKIHGMAYKNGEIQDIGLSRLYNRLANDDALLLSCIPQIRAYVLEQYSKLLNPSGIFSLEGEKYQKGQDGNLVKLSFDN